jgi:tetratricopeptide (TPR) repeat protein
MKKSFVFFCPLLLVTMVLYLSNIKEDATPVDYRQMRVLNAIGCAADADADQFIMDATGKFIRLMPGWGDHSYSISTISDSAQIYFNQGLTMYYSYHPREAVASFREAARFDSTNAILYWAQALAMGPSYNFGYSYKMRPAIPDILEKMNRYGDKASPKEQDLIFAMNTRYNIADTTDKERRALNIAYASSMKPLVSKYGYDVDIKALYTDAVMLIHSWDFWYNDGTPKSWTPELVRYCEDILAKDQQHPAGLHYYIHVTEASRKPEVALASADSLIKLFPGVAHMVHMSSHEYERIGYYAKGVIANEKADKSLVLYDSLAKGLFPFVHVSHYYAVEAYCALSGAMYKKGIQKTLTCRKSVKPAKDDFYAQYLYMFPQLAMVRMGKWQDILNDTTSVSNEWSYAGILNDFAKGMANAKTTKFSEAGKYLNQLREKKKDKALEKKFDPHSSAPFDCSTVAENILLATIRFQQKKYTEAVAAIKTAISIEDKLIYSEPKDWILPARQYLGAFLLQQKKLQEAEKVYREDLVWNPGNGWSMVGLYNALKAQRKTKELGKLQKQYMYSFSDAEVVPATSAY